MKKNGIRAGLYGILLCSFLLAAGCASGEENGKAAVPETEIPEVQVYEAESQRDSSQEPETPKEMTAETADIGTADIGTEETGTGDAEGMTQRVEEADIETPEPPVQEKFSVSIMGDSISTFDGWLPEGFYDFYPLNGEVKDVEQTWWKMLLQEMDLELCVNGSSSGSTCIGDSASMSDPQSGCSDLRIDSLVGENGMCPDMIILYMGTNDVIQSVPLGENNGTQAVAEGVIENFSDAYCLILDKLAVRYPDTQIVCCNLLPVGDWGTEQPFITFRNGQGLASEDYSGRIEMIAQAKGYPVIDLAHCGMTIENMQQYVSDGVHLNAEGMKLVKDAVKNAMAGLCSTQ